MTQFGGDIWVEQNHSIIECVSLAKLAGTKAPALN